MTSLLKNDRGKERKKKRRGGGIEEGTKRYLEGIRKIE